MPVCDQRGDVLLFVGGAGRGGCEEGREREEVAGSGGSVGDKCEDFGDEALLEGGVLFGGVFMVSGAELAGLTIGRIGGLTSWV